MRIPTYRVEDRGYDSPCWVWQGCPDRTGYGRLTYDGSRQQVHRAFYQKHIGPIPEGLEIDHLCRVRLCCNPEHLEPVTKAENVRRGEGGTHQRIKTHCPQGHAYDGANTYRCPKGFRYCRQCKRDRSRAK